jgi:hypothetical protein
VRAGTASSSEGGSSNTFVEQAQRFADTTQQRVSEFVRDQKLDQRAAEAGKAAQERLAELGQQTEQSVRRTYMKLESEHNISGRLRRTQTWLSEAARDVDQEYSVRTRLRGAYEDAQRNLPLWRRQAGEFSSTPGGKAALTLLFVGLLASGLLWQLLNAAWLLWWLSIPVSLLLASQRSKAAAAAASAAAEDAARRRAQGPFGGWGGARGTQASSGGNRGSGNEYGSGPVVEAEWVSLDDDGQPKQGGGSRGR